MRYIVVFLLAVLAIGLFVAIDGAAATHPNESDENTCCDLGERSCREVDDCDDAYNGLLARNDCQQIDGCSRPKRSMYSRLTPKEAERSHIGMRYRNPFPIIVFDFGGVVGGSDRVLVAKAIAPILDVSVKEALTVLTRLRVAKELGVSQYRFWNEYQAIEGKKLPDNWEDHFEDIRLNAIRAKPEMLVLVDDLRLNGYRVAMLSNTTLPRAAFIRRQGFYGHFEPVILSCDIGVKKPSAGAFVTLLNQLKASASDCLLIDDKPENIDAARRLGIDGIVFTTIEELQIELHRRGIYR